MYKFVKEKNNEAVLGENDIDLIEEKLNVKFPKILRDFYLQYNGAYIKECNFEMYDMEFIVLDLYALSYGTMSVEKVMDYDKENESIPNEYYPLAQDDVNTYYWDRNNGKVYYYMIDNAEHPIEICDSVEKFFEILNDSCDKKIKVKGNNKNIPNPYLEAAGSASIDKNTKIDPEKILKYNGKFATYCILSCLVIIIISLLLIPFTDSVSLIIAIVSVIPLAMFLIIDVINRIKTYKALKNNDIKILNSELENAIKLKDIEVYLTDNYIICNMAFLSITKYTDIDWIYLDIFKGRVQQKALVSQAQKISGVPLVAYVKKGKKVRVANAKTNQNLNMILGFVFKNNNKALIGYDYDNIKKYEKINSKLKNKNFIESILLYTFLVLIFIGIVYYNFIK